MTVPLRLAAHPHLLTSLLLALLFTLACGGSSPAADLPEVAERREPKPARSSEKAAQNIPEGERVPSTKRIDRRSRTAVATDSLGVVSRSAAPPKSSAEVYRSVAPATVIIRSGGGLGSGVIIDPEGWVLTNHHVIARGKSEDFRLEAQVILGALSKESGAMERKEKSYRALVYKADKLRDIALLKLEDPPKNLPHVVMSSQSPVPGQKVISLGHAGAGMLWAMKSGEISAMGKLSEQLAELARFKDDEKEATKQFRERLDALNLGLVIQSTCNILPGDSGGPLVSQGGELLGLNAFTNRDRRTGGLLNFHVHIKELRAFVSQRPSGVAQMVPDPWKEGGADMSFEDADLDGKVDVLYMRGRRACSFCPRQSTAALVDLDQDSYAKRSSVPSVKEVFSKRDFDAELIVLQLNRKSYVWYDRDNDGKMDLLLFDSGSTGFTRAAYTIQVKNGEFEKSGEFSSGRVLRLSLFKDSELRNRMSRVSSAVFPRTWSESSSVSASLPDPMGHYGVGRTVDLDRDGKRDGLEVSSAFSTRLLVDADGSSLGSFPQRVEMSDVKPGQLDAEMSLISQGDNLWVWYDTNDDGRFDLVLHSPRNRQYVAVNAWQVDAQGKKVPIAEHVGRKLVRPDLFEVASLAGRVRGMVGKGLMSIMSAESDRALASFPDPARDHRGAGFHLAKVKTAPKAVLVVSGQGSDGYLIDLDQSSTTGKKEQKIIEAARKGKLDAEFAYFQRNGLAWAYFDSDNKGGFDIVLYSSSPRSGKADHGFRIDGSGKVSYDAGLRGTPLASHALFKHRGMARKLEKLGKKLFEERMLQPRAQVPL